MAVLQLCLFPSSLQWHKHPHIIKPQISKTLISSPKIPKLFYPQIIRVPSSSPTKPYPSLQPIYCTRITSSSSEPDDSSSSPTSSIFIKGLAQSTTEGSLRNGFSQFGEVSQVKIITDTNTRRSLGYGYVWFTNVEHAELAAEEMNGKFFDGRFIMVKIGKPGLSKIRGKSAAIPFKF